MFAHTPPSPPPILITMSWATKMLGDTLLVKEGFKTVSKPTDEALAGKKFVALYFSASWCGPCKRFTPLLAVCHEDQAKAGSSEVEVRPPFLLSAALPACNSLRPIPSHASPPLPTAPPPPPRAGCVCVCGQR